VVDEPGTAMWRSRSEFDTTAPYAEAMLVATPSELPVDGKKPKKLTGVTQEQMAKMEREMANPQGQ